MKKLFASLIAVIAPIISLEEKTMGQQENPITVERILKKLPPEGQNTETDRSRCGDYLLFDPDPRGIVPKGPRISYITEARPKDPLETNLIFSFLKGNFRIIIDDSKKIPTAQLSLLNGGALEKVTLRISAADRKKASCLP